MNENFHFGTKMLNEILHKCKIHGDKRGLGYINKDEKLSSGETVFIKGKDDAHNQVESPKKTSLCTYYKNIGHPQISCYIRFLERFETQMNRLMNDFNSLKNNIFNNGRGNKTNHKPKIQFSFSKLPPRTKQVWLRNDRSKCQVVLNALKAKYSSEWYLDSGCSRHMIGDKSFFTSLEDYNGGTVTFENGSLAHVKGKGSISILGYPKLDGVLYV